MSSDSDKYVFMNALEEQDNNALFQAKRWTHVYDSSSANGQFSGQLQFDLNTLSSQNQWTDLQQAEIQFPVRLTIRNNDASTNALTSSIRSACIKNGFHQFVDSIQLVLGGSTIQSSQIFTNVDCSYKILTEWSQDELRKYGPSLGIALDDYNNTTDATTGASLDNITFKTTDGSGLMDRYNGMLYASASTNKGLKERTDFLNTGITSTLAAAAVNDTLNIVGKSNVQQAAAYESTNFVAFYLATIRLKDLSDAVKKIPPIKNLKGYLYLNYNSASSTYTSTTTSGEASAAMTNTPIYGRCQPGIISRKDTHGACNITFKTEISGVSPDTLTTAKPPLTNARLVVPYYVASPEIDRALTQKKTIRYNERFVSVVPIDSKQSTNTTITPGISNPKRIIMLPVLYGDGSADDITGLLANPELSPFDIAATGGSSAFAAIRQLQVYVANQPMFQQPVDFDHDMFLQEVCQQGANGGLDSEINSGLLSQKLWNQMYRYYTVDIGRRLNCDDGASKSVQVSCYNPCGAKMRLITIIWYDREIVIDTAMGTITQNF